jgi:hypothetical protein
MRWKALLVAATIGFAGSAGAGDDEPLMDLSDTMTVKEVGADHVVTEGPDGSVFVRVDARTVVQEGTKTIEVAELEPGDRVVVQPRRMTPTGDLLADRILVVIEQAD